MARNIETRTPRRVSLPGVKVHRGNPFRFDPWHTAERRLIVGIAVGVATAAALLLVLPRDMSQRILTESGPVEHASALLYLAAFVAAGALAVRARVRVFAATAVVLLAFGLRELDFHDRFTTRAVSQLRFFASSDVPLAEKAVVTLVLLGLGAAAGYLVWIAGGAARGGYRALRQPGALAAAVGLALLPLSLLCDRVVRLLTYDWALDPDHTLPYLIWIAEEVTELASPLLFLAALLFWGRWLQRQASRRHRPARGDLTPV